MAEASPDNTLDVVIVGAGFAGMYALHSFRGMGLQAKVLKQVVTWGALGTGIATRARDAMCPASSIPTALTKIWSKSGTGLKSWRLNPRYWNTPTMSPIVSICVKTFSFKRAWPVRYLTKAATGGMS